MKMPYDRGAMIASLDLALPYIRLYRGRIFVIKIGGAASSDPDALSQALAQVHVLRELGMRPVLVHGGGPQTTRLAERLGIEARFVEGRRLTSPAMLDAVVMTLNGTVSTAILSVCRSIGMEAIGISGVDAAMIRARVRPPVRKEMEGGPVDVDFGEVGDIVDVDGSVLERILGAGFVPVVSPLAADDTGRVLNINADTVAARIAATLSAEKLIFLTDAPGILENAREPASLISYVDLAAVEDLERRGVLSGGMLPKVSAARSALEAGVRRVHIVGHKPAGSLLAEIFTNEGAGTLIVHDRTELQASELASSAVHGSPGR